MFNRIMTLRGQEKREDGSTFKEVTVGNGPGLLAGKTRYAVQAGRRVKLDEMPIVLSFPGRPDLRLRYQLSVMVKPSSEEKFARALHVEKNPTVAAAELNLYRKVEAKVVELAGGGLATLSNAYGEALPLDIDVGAELWLEFKLPPVLQDGVVHVRPFGMTLRTSDLEADHAIELTFTCVSPPGMRLLAALQPRSFGEDEAVKVARAALPGLFVTSIVTDDLLPGARGSLEQKIRATLDDALAPYGRRITTLRPDVAEPAPQSARLDFPSDKPFRWYEKKDEKLPLALEIECQLRLVDAKKYLMRKRPPLLPWLEKCLEDVLYTKLRDLTREAFLLQTEATSKRIEEEIQKHAATIGYEAQSFVSTPRHKALELAREPQRVSVPDAEYGLARGGDGSHITGHVSAVVGIDLTPDIAVKRYLDDPDLFVSDVTVTTRAALTRVLMQTSAERFHLSLDGPVKEGMQTLRADLEAAIASDIVRRIEGAVVRVGITADARGVSEFVNRFRDAPIKFELPVYPANAVTSIDISVWLEIDGPNGVNQANWARLIEIMGRWTDPAKDEQHLTDVRVAIANAVRNHLEGLPAVHSAWAIAAGRADADRALELAVLHAANQAALNMLGVCVKAVAISRGTDIDLQLVRDTAASEAARARALLNARHELGLNEIETALLVSKNKNRLRLETSERVYRDQEYSIEHLDALSLSPPAKVDPTAKADQAPPLKPEH